MPTVTQTAEAVQHTSDYNQFIFMNNNRDTNSTHINRLKDTFAERGNFLPVQPILVNERMEIIDGQHRFLAAQELGEPIYYTVREGLTVEDARQMNLLHRSWRPSDFAESYAASGDSNYRNYLTLQEEFEVGHAIMLAAIYGGDMNGAFAIFRRGDLALTDEDAAGIRDRLTKMTEIMERAEQHDKALAYAIMRVINVNGYNHDRMLQKIASYGTHYLRHFRSVNDYLRALEDTYNHNNAESNRLRLY